MIRRAMVWAFVAALLSGCAGRQILSIQDSVGASTILTTIDTKSYLVYGESRLVYWECGMQGQQLVCEKRCDVRDDEGDRLVCPKTAGISF